MIVFTLEWFTEKTGGWREQYRSYDKAVFDSYVSDLAVTANKEGGWMDDAQWRIGQYDMVLIHTKGVTPDELLKEAP